MSPTPGLVQSGFQATRVRVASTSGFDEVASGLKTRMGSATVAEIVQVAAEAADETEFERLVTERFVGPSDFMLFAEMDHGSWITVYGIRRRTVRLVLGNPLIAITMMREDLSAGLFAPVEILLTETADGSGCTIEYVLPSSLIAGHGSNPRLTTAARVLDQKLAALVADATGLVA